MSDYLVNLRDGSTYRVNLMGMSDTRSNSVFLVFSVGIKWEHELNELKQKFERAQQKFLGLYKIPN